MYFYFYTVYIGYVYYKKSVMGQKRTLLLNPTNYTTEFKSLQSQRFRRRLQNGFQLFLRI